MSIREPLNRITYKSLEKIDLSEHHPLGYCLSPIIRSTLIIDSFISRKNFPPTKIMTLANLIKEVAPLDVTIFLSCPGKVEHKEKLANLIQKNETVFKNRICMVSPNPVFIYQLRKEFPDLLCGLWLGRGQEMKLKWLKSWTIFNSIKGAFLRSVISPLIGIKLVFIHKSEFNE